MRRRLLHKHIPLQERRSDSGRVVLFGWFLQPLNRSWRLPGRPVDHVATLGAIVVGSTAAWFIATAKGWGLASRDDS